MGSMVVRIAAASVLLAASGLASAASYCSTTNDGTDATKNLAADGQKVSDVTYSASGNPPYANANDCYGVVSGNDTATQINALTWGTGWQLAAKDNTDSSSDTSNTVNNVTWSLVDMGNTTGGSWTLNGTGSGVPGVFDFTIVLKGSNGFAAYFFDNVSFTGSGGGTFAMSITNNGGNIAGLSHLTVYTRAGDGGGGGGGGNTPEPMSLALVAAALLGARAAVRRRT